jgi:hypothetical protein
MPRCFVIQRFDKGPYDKRYRDVLVPAIKKAGLDPYRVDEDPRATILIEDIERGIRGSDICLADITPDNPNIWYEIGYALASNKPIVLVCMDPRPTPFPFDIRHRQVILYSLDAPSDFHLLGAEITSRLMAQLEGSAERPPSSDDAIKLLSSEVSSLRKDLSEIVRTITAKSRPAKDKKSHESPEHHLEDLQGIWHSGSGSIYCARVVDGELLIPYKYYANYPGNEPTSHLYNCKLVGDTLFCLFAWFNSPISGVMVLNIISGTCLRGGWWATEAAPPRLLNKGTDKHRQISELKNDLILTKKGTISDFPEWATRYFANPRSFAAMVPDRRFRVPLDDLYE